jgi:hypothetical protein
MCGDVAALYGYCWCVVPRGAPSCSKPPSQPTKALVIFIWLGAEYYREHEQAIGYEYSYTTVPLAHYTALVDAFPPRHSGRPFHLVACLLPPHPPITQAPATLPPAVRATSFALSPVPSLLLSSSPAPPSAALA